MKADTRKNLDDILTWITVYLILGFMFFLVIMTLRGS